MIVIPTALTDGVLRPTGPYPADLDVSVCNGDQVLCYSHADNVRPLGHQHWLMAPYINASLAAGSEVGEMFLDHRIEGIVWLTNWQSCEPTFNNYNFFSLGIQLDRAKALGKKLIVRCYAKTYSGAFTDPAGALPTPLAVPDYIPLDPMTYGGSAYRGGLYKVHQGTPTPVGWGTAFENANVRARWKALVTAVHANFGGHPALAGWIGPDESARSAWDGSSLPSGMSASTVVAANKDIWTHDASTFGAALVWPCINYIDSTDTLSVANQTAIDLQAWAAAQGMNIAISDTIRVPEMVDRFLQPVYYSTPRSDMASGRKTLVHVDYLSLGAVDAGLTQRIIDSARQTYRLRADITAWNPRPNVAGYWEAQKAAIDATA